MRQHILLEVFAELDMVLANVGASYNLKGRDLGSILDLAYVSAALVSKVA